MPQGTGVSQELVALPWTPCIVDVGTSSLVSLAEGYAAYNYIVWPLYGRDKYAFHCVIFSSRVSS